MIVVTNTDPGAKDPLVGQRVGDSYVITQMLGSGGMGTVYLAESAALGGLKIAVKVLTTKSSDAVARFVREAYAAGKVNDQFSVVGLIDTGVLPTGQHYIALQYCDGGSLQAVIEQRGTKPLPYDDVLAFMSPVCAALVHAHASNLVHRDLKPANILFVKDGSVLRARLADFGIVKLRERVGLLLTAPKSAMGTPGYMSPEQWTDTGQVDSRSDIYSIGCMLYELVTGRLPYKGTINEVMYQTTHNAPITPPAALRPDLPPLWNSTIMRCLAHRREDRIQTILEVIQNLASALESGEATMGFFAPSLVTSIATAPTANTISQSAGGPARTLWSQAHSAIQRKNPPPPSGRRSWGLFVAGIAIGTVLSSAVAFMARSAPPATASPRIALEERKEASAIVAPVSSQATRLAPEPLPPTASPSAATTSTPAPSAKTLHIDAAGKETSTPAVAAANLTNPAPRTNESTPRASEGMPMKQPKQSPTTASSSESSPTRATITEPPSKPTQPGTATTGELVVSVDPYAEVWLDNKPVGPTPLSIRVRVGAHRLRLINKDLAVEKSVAVTVSADKPTRIEESW